jgi:hypothetical protein
MRCFVFRGTVMTVVLAAFAWPAVAQRVPPGDPAARPVYLPFEPNRLGSDGHHPGNSSQHWGYDQYRHRGGRSWGWFDIGFPGGFGGGYTPAFPEYFFPPVNYFSYNVLLPPSNFVGSTGTIQPPAPAPNPQPAAIDPPAPDPKPKTTGAEQKARAGRYIGFGDANFGKQKYLAALERYKTAGKSAPDVAEAYMRQGFALFAMGQYGNAAAAFRRGLRIRGDWTGSPFRLDQLYDGGKLTKTAHLESLAKAVEANPLDAEQLLVLGMASFFDGQRDRAGVFFAGSAQLGGNEDHLLDGFLPQNKPGDPAGGAGKIVF